MLKTISVALSLASASAVWSGPALALQTIVTQVDKNANGSMTYHFAVKLDPGETMAPGDKAMADFVTVYNFYGLVNGSAKSPTGWTFSSEEFGRTPMSNGYPLVMPVDIPNTPNLTWTATKAVEAGARIEGFAATTQVGAMVEGEYSAQTTRQTPTVKDVAGASGAEKASKQASIGMIPAPRFLADVK